MGLTHIWVWWGGGGRVGLVAVLLGILDWRTPVAVEMGWSESEASFARVLAVEVRGRGNIGITACLFLVLYL